MKISEVLIDFIDNCFTRGLSPATIDNYRRMVGFFIDFIGDVDIVLVTDKFILSYTDFLLNKIKVNTKFDYDVAVSRQTVRTYLKQLSVFLNWCYKNGFIKSLIDVKLPKKHDRLVDIYTDFEIQQIYKFCCCPIPWLKFRNLSLFSLFYDSGLRVSEACTLTIHDINFEKGFLKVHGKGQKDRFVPLGSLTSSYLKKYISLCPYSQNDSFLVFYSNTGDILTPNAVENLFYRIRKNTGIKVSAHKLRHNFATNYLVMQYQENGKADIYQLMLILGHSDVDTTMIYLHMAQQIVLCFDKRSKLDCLSDLLPVTD